jgi:hypothetical protein
MALIACPECGQKISSDALSCPHCGKPLDPTAERIDYVTGEPVAVTPRPAAQAAPRPGRYPSTAGFWMMVGGSIAVLLGSFMPWIRLGPLTISGMSGDGPITLALGIAMLLTALSARASASAVPRVLVLIGAVASAAVAMIDTNRLVEGGIRRDLIGPGLGFIFLGGLVAFVGSFLKER